jgi:hypothetical protein
MPFYDRGCLCGWRKIDSYETVYPETIACPACGATTERIWISKATNVIGDACDIIQSNGFRHPRRFTSKIERQRALKEAGLSEVVRHVGAPGSDRSRHTTNWAATTDARTLDNARILVSRASTFAGTTPEPPLKMRITHVRGEGIG